MGTGPSHREPTPLRTLVRLMRVCGMTDDQIAASLSLDRAAVPLLAGYDGGRRELLSA